MPKKMFLIDGSNHAFRLHFGLPPQHNSQGFPTRVLYGFTLLMQKIRTVYRPDYCAVSFDIGKSFRHDDYPAYKAQRPPMPEDLRKQWGLLPDLVRGFGVPCVNLKGFEADDVIGTLAHQFANEDIHAYIVSSDKDFCQLVSDHVFVFNERKDALLGRKEVVEKMGVKASQVVDLLGLAGDSSDNIPGVPGVGGKTAAKLLNTYGTMEEILSAAQAGEIKGKRGDNLRDFADDALLSRGLARIVTDAPTNMGLQDLEIKGLQEDSLRSLFDQWEFGMVARKLLSAQQSVDPESYWVVRTKAEFDRLGQALSRASLLAIDLSTSGERVGKGESLGLSLSWGDKDAVYVPLVREQGLIMERDEVIERLKVYLENPRIGKVGHQMKDQWHGLHRLGIQLKGIEGDTQILDYVSAAHRRSLSLDSMSQRHLGHTLSSHSGQQSLLNTDVSPSMAERAHVVWLLHQRLLPGLQHRLPTLYKTMEIPLIPILAEMELAGIVLDVDRLLEVQKDVGERVVLAEARCHELAGRPFKVSSPKEASLVLFTELGLTPIKKTKTGFSTDSSVLEKLTEFHPLPAALLEFRQLQKLESTYLSKLPAAVDREDGRIHTTFNQAVTATGRLSSTDPNLQNIPIRTEEGRRIRECFIPPPDHIFLSADYSQVELRVLAHFSGAPTLVNSFHAGEDIHARTASEVLKISMDEVTREQRSAAKAINFGLLYGMSAFRLGRSLSISRKEAEQYMEDYFGRMPEVSDWLDETKERCRKQGFVETLFGRRRMIPEISSKNFGDRMAAEREAVNTRVQGTAADIIKLAMLGVDRAMQRSSLRGTMILQVHDELLFEVHKDDVKEVTAIVMEEMQSAAKLAVPLAVNIATGAHWDEAH